MAHDHRRNSRRRSTATGSDLAAWSDQSLANEVRVARLADRGFRARLDAAAALDTGLVALRGAIDAEIVASRAAERVQAGVLAAAAASRHQRPALGAGGGGWSSGAAASGALRRRHHPGAGRQRADGSRHPRSAGLRSGDDGGAMTDLTLPRRRDVPWLFIGLAASLTLNALFIGAVATDAIRFSAAEKQARQF